VPQSLSAVYVHLVFSTKERRPLLLDERIRDSLHLYLGGISKRLRCAPIITGGVEDHVHLLARFGRTITQAEWVKELKRVSNLETVKKYIANQQYHHRKMNFQDELRTLLRRHEVDWDERYIWD